MESYDSVQEVKRLQETGVGDGIDMRPPQPKKTDEEYEQEIQASLSESNDPQ